MKAGVGPVWVFAQAHEAIVRLVKEKEGDEGSQLKSCREHKDKGEIGTIVNDSESLVEAIDVPVADTSFGLMIQLLPMYGITVFTTVEIVSGGHAPGKLEAHDCEDQH